jgi:hypothetical protein
MESTADLLQQTDEMKARAILNEIQLPPELAAISLERKNDSSGDPAIYISFQVKDEAVLDRETTMRLSRFMSSVAVEILKSGISLFPYVSLDQAA